jgi:hypothetical protein
MKDNWMRKLLMFGLAVMPLAGTVASVMSVSAQAQTKQPTQDSAGQTTDASGIVASKQKTDGGSPPMVGPGSRAYKQPEKRQ